VEEYEKINEKQNIPGSLSSPVKLKKKQATFAYNLEFGQVHFISFCLYTYKGSFR
jgi:hypothetical protein